MYSIRRDFNPSIYDTMNHRQKIKTKPKVFSSTKYLYHRNKLVDELPVYRTSYTFEKPMIGIHNRTSLVSFCVPDVYSSGSNGKSSPPPPSSNLPLPPLEWLI